MANATRRIDAGRVIFLSDKWIVQTLESHVANVARLAELWSNDKAFQGSVPDLARTRAQVIRAAQIHDMGKPNRFRLEYKPQHDKWEYSFAGHRFDAFDDDAYAQMLAQLHHIFSVEDITKHMAQLKLKDETKAIAENLPLDLYALEMCDQIEATVARAALGSEDPEERVFMDFQFRARTVGEYEIEPFAFSVSPLRMTVEYVELIPPQDKRLGVERTSDDGRRRAALRDIQKWLVAELQSAPAQHKEVVLWPWMT